MNVHEPGLATRINAEPTEPAERPGLFCEFCGFWLNVVPCGVS